MAIDHLAGTRSRSLIDESSTSEAAFHQTDNATKDAWLVIQEIKDKMSIEKKMHIGAVNAKYEDVLKTAEDEYALLLSLSR